MLVCKDPLHQSLWTWSIAQHKWHPVPLEQLKGSAECSLLFVLFSDWYLVLPSGQVQSREPAGT